MKQEKSKRIEIIDGLRGVAVIMVVIVCHYVGNHFEMMRPSGDANENILKQIVDLNITGVHLFFIISGFLLGGILLDNRGAQGFFGSFYVRRLTRILPLYFASLLLFCIMTPFLDERFDWLSQERLPIWSYAVFLQNNAMAAADTFGGNWLAPTWSLAVEEQFYIILPFLIFYTPPRHLPKLLLAGILLAPLLRAAAGLGIGGTASIVLLTSCMDALCYGLLAAYAVRSESIRKLLQANHRLLGHGAWLLPAAGFAVSYFGDALDVGARIVVSFWLITTGFTALLLYATQHSGTWLHHILATGWLRWVGVRCYAIYLFHQAVIGLLGGFLAGSSDFMVTDLRSLAVWLMSIAVILALAALSWRFVERPLIAFGHRWAYQRPQTARTPKAGPPMQEASGSAI